eukprot:tig00000317_g24019.t1
MSNAPPAEAPGLRSLPSELLAAVLGHLTVRERAAAALVSRSWRTAAAAAPHTQPLELIAFGDCAEAADLGPARLALNRYVEGTARRFMGEAADALAPLARRALAAGEAARALRAPLCAGASALRLVLLLADPEGAPAGAGAGAGAEAGGEASPLAFLLAGAPPALESLELVLPATLYPAAVGRACALLDLGRCTPRLRTLALRAHSGVLGELPPESAPRLPLLERVAAHVPLADGSPAAAEALLASLPALRRVDRVSTRTPEAEAGASGARPVRPVALAALAAAGVACGALAVGAWGDCPTDLSAPEDATAVAALFRPAAFEEGPGPGPGSGDCGGLALATALLPAEWPRGAFAGAESILLCDTPVHASTLRWLAGGAHAATLRELRIEASEVPLHATAAPATGELLGLLDALPRARMWLFPPASWPESELEELLLRAVASGDLLLRLQVAQTEATFDEESPAGAAYAAYRDAREALLGPERRGVHLEEDPNAAAGSGAEFEAQAECGGNSPGAAPGE